MASGVLVAFGRRGLSALCHGPSGAVATLATVPGEGRERFSGSARSHDRMSSAATEGGNEQPTSIFLISLFLLTDIIILVILLVE